MTKFKEVLGNTRVFYRIYPSENPDWDNLRLLEDGKSIKLHSIGPSTNKNATNKIFETDGYFYNRPQSEIYSVVMDGVLESLFGGQNAIILAFGQTGSGKSLTIGGFHSFYQDRGLIPRAIENIFSFKEKLPKNLEVTIHISYLEVLSSLQLRDLLKPYPCPVKKNMMLKQLHKMEVKSVFQTLQLIFLAEGRKEYTPDTNHPSHAGSSILTFEFTVSDTNFTVPYEFKTKLHIIDLAGNDRFGDNSSTFKSFQQVGSANYTKSFFEHFLLLLCGDDPELTRVKKRTHVVSQYLGDTFSRGSLMRLIGHLKTSKYDHNITKSLLKFGQLFKATKSQYSTVVLKEDESKKMALLEEKLINFYKEKLIKQMLQNQEPTKVCLKNSEHLQKLVEDFVHSKIEASRLLTMGDIFTILQVMKENILTFEGREDMLDNKYIAENLKTPIEKSESSLKATLASKTTESSVSYEVKKSESKISETINVRDSFKGKHVKKTSTCQTLDEKSVYKKGKASAISLNSNRRISISTKIKKGTGDSTVSAEKSSKKGTDNQQNSSIFSTFNLILPDLIPGQKEAVREYVQSPRTSYKSLSESFKKYENEAKEIYLNYLREIKKLNAYFEILDLRRNEAVQTKLLKQLSSKHEKYSEKSKLEEKCNENLDKAESDVIRQQEIVLSLQADLKIALSMRQQVKNDMKEDFQEFCEGKYTVPVLNLDNTNDFVLENEVEIRDFCEEVENDEVTEEIPQEQIYEEMYKNLREMMKAEAKKKAFHIKNSTK